MKNPPTGLDYLKQMKSGVGPQGGGSEIFNLTEVEKRRAQLSPEANALAKHNQVLDSSNSAVSRVETNHLSAASGESKAVSLMNQNMVN